MIAILFLMLMSTQVIGLPFDCDQVVAKNGTLKAFRIYKYYDRENETISYRLYRDDIEVVVELQSNGSLVYKSIKTIPTVGYKFSLMGNEYTTDKDITRMIPKNINCKAIPKKDKKMDFKCSNFDKDLTNTQSDLTFPDEPIFVKPLKESEEDFGVLVFDRNNRTDYSFLNMEIHQRTLTILPLNCHLKEGITNCSSVSVEQMGDSVFKGIKAVVDIPLGEKMVYLILFKVNGSQKYCLTPGGQRLSKECNDFSQMKTLFEECFNSSTAEPMSRSTNTKFWIIVSSLVIGGIVAIGIIGFFIYRYELKTTTDTNSNTTSGSKSGHTSSSVHPKLTSKTLIK